MNHGQTVFAQVMGFVPHKTFERIVERYGGDYKVKHFSCWDQFLCMAFAQLTYRESLRDIEVCLRAHQVKLYHMGIRGRISRNTIANANRVRDWRIYGTLAKVLITRARRLYINEEFGIHLKRTVYALDASTIDLCLALFPWAHFRKTKGAIKLHTLLDLRGSIPSIVVITAGKVHDVNILDELCIERGAIYIMDRGYLDFTRLYRMHQQGGYFVTRLKRNTKFRRLYSRKVEQSKGLRCDQVIVLTGLYARKDYPEKLRRICYVDPVSDKRLVFLTNIFFLSAMTIAKLYRQRWKVELFFKWIKQHLRIKAFYGTTMNAVKTQVWIAISTYLLVAIMKKELNIEQASLYTILQILSVTLFEKKPILQAFSHDDGANKMTQNHNQLLLFD